MCRLNKGHGFTLVELMIVISIIMVLVAILAPAVNSAIITSYAAKVQARVQELDKGCVQYYRQNNFYPGQNNLERLQTGTHGDAVTGSQMLAEALFTDPVGDANWDGANGGASHKYDANRQNWHWKTQYASINFVRNDSRSDLMTGAPCDTKPYAIADRFTNNFLPILYYPAHPSDTGIGQFWENDNNTYLINSGTRRNWIGQWTPAILTLEDGNPVPTTFNNFSWDRRYKPSGTDVYHSGEYLLIAAGRDRLYGTGFTIKNWSDK